MSSPSPQFPTFLDLAGVQPPEDLDGRSLKSIVLGKEEAEVEPGCDGVREVVGG